MNIKGRTMYACWEELNRRFLYSGTSRGMLIPSRDFSRVLWPVRLHASQGFGVDGDYGALPPFFSSFERRIKLLANRYIDEDLFQEGVDRLRARQRRMAVRNPLSFVINFHRRATAERKVPAGGGCLQTITFVWCEARWGLMVNLRASEITARLLADIAFVDWVVKRIIEEVPLKNWDGRPEIIWDIGLASQMKYMIPLFFLFLEGEEELFHAMFKSPKSENEWYSVVIQHFWDVVIHPEKISWAQRRKWSEVLLRETSINWSKAERQWRRQFRADL